MRFLCLLFLLAVGTVATVFVLQNDQALTLTLFNRGVSAPVSAILGIVYVLGMLTGWSLLGLLRRSFDAATDFRRREAANAR
ncbi:MAG TPA: hypothetical protein VH643_06010 [Gemmataceae bacterium]|jgi:uncharacterized membrane protein YciS (DUF1049 family)